jgi:anti-sigma regulatory factor (Ser/Thr protein kinase)
MTMPVHRSSTTPEVTLTLVTKTAYLCSVRAFVESYAQRTGFSHHQAGHIVLALDEALANVIRHGYHGSEHERVSVAFWAVSHDTLGPGLQIVIDDEGEQIDPTAVRGRDLDDVKPGGLGVHIMRQVMDDVHYERRPQRGMRLTLVKLINSQAPVCRECS